MQFPTRFYIMQGSTSFWRLSFLKKTPFIPGTRPPHSVLEIGTGRYIPWSLLISQIDDHHERVFLHDLFQIYWRYSIWNPITSQIAMPCLLVSSYAPWGFQHRPVSSEPWKDTTEALGALGFTNINPTPAKSNANSLKYNTITCITCIQPPSKHRHTNLRIHNHPQNL